MPNATPVPALVMASDYADSNDAGLPSMASADVAANPFRRAIWIAQCMSGAGCWAQTPTPDTTGINGVINTASAREWHLGKFNLAPTDTAFARIEVWIHISAFTASTSGLTIKAIAPDGTSVALTRPTATGWSSGPDYLPQGGQWEIVAKAASGTQNLVIDSICFLAAPPASPVSPSTFPKRYLPWIAANRPYDVDTVATIDQQLTHVQERYPRTLASHSLTSGAIGAGGQTFTWQTRRGPVASAVDVWIYMSAIAGGVTIKTLTDGVQADVSGLDAASVTAGVTISGASGSKQINVPGGAHAERWIGFTVDATEWTANAANVFQLAFSGTGGDATTLEEVIAVEQDFTPSSYLINDGATPPARWDLAPQKLIIPATPGLRPNAPIIGSFWEADTDGTPIVGTTPVQRVQWGDRRTAMHNAIYHAIYRSQVLIFDRLSVGFSNVTSADFGDVASTGIGTAPALARWKHVTRRGAKWAHIWVKARISTTAAPGFYNAAIVVTNNNDTSPTVAISPIIKAPSDADMNPNWENWIDLGRHAVTEDAIHDMCLLGGFVVAQSNLATGQTTVPAQLFVDGIRVVEEAEETPTGQNAAFYSLPAVNAQAIPSGSSTGVTKTLTVAGTFNVRHVRFWARVTSTHLSHLHAKLIAPDATEVEVTPAAWASGLLDAVSDDGLLDEAPANPLSAFIGLAAHGTWSLKVYDLVVETPGTFDQFGLELT